MVAEAAKSDHRFIRSASYLDKLRIVCSYRKKMMRIQFGLMTGEQDKARCFLAGHVAPTPGFLRRKS